MARKTETVKVDEHVYQITQLQYEPGLKLYNQLAHVLGDSIRDELKAGGAVEEILPRIMLRALSVIPFEMMLEITNSFCATSKLVMGNLALEMNESIREQQFEGETLHWTLWVLACLRVQFSDFLSRAKRSMPAQPEPQKTTTASA